MSGNNGGGMTHGLEQLLGHMTRPVDEELRRRNAYLAAENRILRNQIKARRVQLTDAERKTLAEISDQTVGNILKRHGIPPVPGRKTTMTWKEFIRIHRDVLVATDFFTREVGTWFTLMIASLLGVIHVGRRTRPVAGVTVLLHERWRLSISPRCSDGHADVGR
jgi:hypothetical protein